MNNLEITELERDGSPPPYTPGSYDDNQLWTEDFSVPTDEALQATPAVSNDNIHGSHVVARLLPTPPLAVPQLAEHLYYQLFQDGYVINPRQPFQINDDGPSLLGRLRPNHISPPRNVKMLKQAIARLEGFVTSDVDEVYLPPSDEPATNFLRLALDSGAPGSVPTLPINVVIRDGASRLPEPGTATVTPITSTSTLIPPQADHGAESPQDVSPPKGAHKPPGWIEGYIEHDNVQGYSRDGSNVYKLWGDELVFVNNAPVGIWRPGGKIQCYQVVCHADGCSPCMCT
ncbi:hypothetical protein DL93DRAFT_1974208 [Clavulina sp. PMI_390]|nr:hypothetical protein DL93DRAFT_1974208 [Clavulina sp. PMI_390]